MPQATGEVALRGATPCVKKCLAALAWITVLLPPLALLASVGLGVYINSLTLGPRGFLTGGAKIPGFLEPWKQKILLAGKYLNVVRECGKEIGREDGADAANVDDAARGQGRDGQLVSMTDDR